VQSVKISFLRMIPFVLGTVFVAGIVHISTILLMPQLAGQTGAARLTGGAQVNVLEHLQQVSGDTLLLPFADPALQTATCHYNVSESPVRLRVQTGDYFMSVVFISENGRLTYALTDKAATRRIIDILVVTESQLRQVEAQDPDDEPIQELRLRVSEPRGLAIVRAFVPKASDQKAVAALLERSVCKTE
jgi:uncharacterized membrane protein